MGRTVARAVSPLQATAGPQLPARALETFSRMLLALGERAGSASPPRLMAEGLELLRPLVPFDAAWWGEVGGLVSGTAPRSWLDGRIGLAAGFTREWNAIAGGDAFAQRSMQRLDLVERYSGYADRVPEIEAFARRHDLHEVMAVTRALEGSGFLQFIVLYRHRGQRPFDDAEALVYAEYSAHLMRAWTRRVQALLGRQAQQRGEAHALVDAQGRLVYLGARLGRLLREHHPDADPALLPAPLMTLARKAPATAPLGRQRLHAQTCGDLVLLALAHPRDRPVLPPRELSVATLYAQGRSHKEIAQLSGLTPATVRTYLRSAYATLGVGHKLALAEALGTAPARR